MRIDRKQLAKFLPDNESIRIFEELNATADKAYSSAGVLTPLAAPVSSAGTLVDAMSVTVEKGGTYSFEFVGGYTASTGFRWVVDGPTTSFFVSKSEYPLSTTADTTNNVNAYNLPAAANASSASSNIVRVSGFIAPTASGSLTLKFSGTGTLSVGYSRLIRLT